MENKMMNTDTQNTTAQENTDLVTKKEQTPAQTSASEKKEETPKTKKTREVVPCKIDIKKNAIVVTKEFAKRANVIDSPEFKRLSDLCRGYPNFKVVARTASPSTTRPSMKGLTKDFMEKHIKKLHADDWVIYEKQKEISEAFQCPYMYMRKWFVERYPEWRKTIIQEIS